MTKKIDELYAIAQRADDEFQTAVIRQFGKRNAGLMRYASAKHNPETASASERYHIAANEAVQAMMEHRTSAAVWAVKKLSYEM